MIIHPLDISFNWRKSKLKDLDFLDCTYLEISNPPEIPGLKTIVINFSNSENLYGLENNFFSCRLFKKITES